MQFIPKGPEVPDDLLRFHEDGKVVFFCGAGISKGAGLPDFKGLVKRVWKEICQKFGEYIPHEVKVFIDRVVEGVAHIAHRVYYQENDEWVEHTTTRKIPESELPPDILALHSKQKKNRKTDITDILRMELS